MERDREERLAHLSKHAIVNRSLREQFYMWVKRRPRIAATMSLPSLLLKFGRPLAVSSAYRAALAAGVRGQRRNRSRYDAFWRSLDWSLPDGTLESIWHVGRGNLRHRRLRLEVGKPKFDARDDRHHSAYIDAVRRETARAATYEGPVPR